jgi:hypothetical protein
MSEFTSSRADGTPIEPTAGVWATAPATADATHDSARDRFPESIWRSDTPAPAGAAVWQPLIAADTPMPIAVSEDGTSMLPIALLAGAGAALLGGLLWAGVVIVTHLDVGILAWLIGAGTGLAIARVGGGPAAPEARVLAGGLAAGGIMVGKYVIFVHALRKAFAELSLLQLPSVGYLDTRQMSLFIHHFGSIVRPIYFLWVALAFFAAYRTAGGDSVRPRRR